MMSTDGRSWLSVLGLLLLAALNHSTAASSLPAGFADAPVSRPDGQVWDGAAGVAFANDGRMFVWERPGRVWLIAGAAAGGQPLIDLSAEVSTIGSLGLTGFALDPQFAQNGYLYLFYSVDPEYLANCASPASGAVTCRATYRAGQHASGGATIGRLVRYQLMRPAGAQDFSSASTVNYTSRRVLLGETPDGGGAPAGCVVTDIAHGPGGLAFGNDGTLLVGCGDGAAVSTEDAGSDPDTQYQQALTASLMTPAENVGAFRAQLVESLSGKILRLDAANGDGMPSNPFYDVLAPRAARSRIWALGLHNPQHFSVRPGSGSARLADGRPGTLYIGDLGDSSWESLAVARDARMNFGWPLYEGVGNDTTGYAALPAFNLYAANPLFQGACAQRYFQFRDLLSTDSLHPSWPNPCASSLAIPAADDLFVRDRPAIDWLHGGADARWAAVDDSGEPLALTLGTRAPNGTMVSGPLFGGTVSIGGVWYQGSSFPPPFTNVYYHADSGGEWIKAFTFDANDNPVAVRDFLSNGGPIKALGADRQTGDLYYISGSGSEVHRLSYAPASPATAVPAAAAPAPIPATQLDGGASVALPSIAAPAAATTRKTLAASNLEQALTTANWSSGDVGAVSAAGSYSLSGSTYTVSGSGIDVWNAADGFQFVSQPLTGDGSITARVVSQGNTNIWAKAGVMFRDTLNPAAINAYAAITPSNGVVYQLRPSTGAASFDVTYGPIVAAPYWVRMVRAGNLFTAYYSPDGNTWTSLGQYTLTMASQAYVGLAVTSHNNGTLSTAVFDNVTVVSATAAPIGLSVTPHVAAITSSQSQQFTAAVSGGATWTVDGIAGGNATVGTISATGLYLPGSAAGAHTIVATGVVNPSQSASTMVGVTDLAGVYTYHNDLARDGVNSHEYALTTSNVNTSSFGKLATCTTDGAIYTQPLWVANLTLGAVRHNVVFVATEHDSLYAFDADASPCVTLWSVSLTDAGHGGTGGELTVPSVAPGNLVGAGFGDLSPEIGVTGTPVIDAASGTLYVVSKSMNPAGTTFYQRLHAIDVTTGLEKTGSPVTISGTYPGTGDGGAADTFNTRQQLQRTGLALVNGVVYIAWCSHEDTAPYYGWVIGYTYNGSGFAQVSIINLSPNAQYGGIWMSGAAPAADANSNLYLLTGNGLFNANSSSAPNNDYGDSLVKLTSALKVADYFTPTDQSADNTGYKDFGGGGAAILADLTASPLPHLILGGGKDGTLYVLNRDGLGFLGDGAAVQVIAFGHGIFATGAYWNNRFYLAGNKGPLTAYLLDPSIPQFNLAAASLNSFNFPGSSPSVSAAGTANGIVWALDTSNYCTTQSGSCRPAVLHAYNAMNVASEVWNSSMVSTDAAGNAVKFAVPTIANGKVYLGTRGNNTGGVFGSSTVSGELDIYGLKSN